MKSVWNPLFPQINISEQFESLCKGQTRLNQQWDRKNTIIFWFHVASRPSRDVVVSLFRDSYTNFSLLYRNTHGA